MSKQKVIVAMDVSSTGKGGGPFTSTMNVINSSLKDKYDYRLFTYKTEMGRFISVKRIKDIVQQLREINPDIVHFTGLQLSGFHIAVACFISGYRNNIVVIRGSSTEALNIGYIKRKLIYVLEFFTLLITKKFYGVSKYSSVVGAAKHFKNKSLGYIYNLPAPPKSIQIYSKDELGFKEDDIIIISVGRIIKDKGYPVLGEAIKLLKDYQNIKFLIIGDGDYLSIMRTELFYQENIGQVRFLGYRDDVYSILPACDIFVLPTLHETLSNALLEASSFGLPLIASDVGGVPEIITNGVNGFLVKPSNSRELSEAIFNLASDKNMCSKMGEAARKNLEKKFSVDTILIKIDNAYKKVLKKNNK